ncbi:cellulose synthase subunit BcsC-related outer membrane protein [Xylophilus sp. GW821-FHT01B05]
MYPRTKPLVLILLMALNVPSMAAVGGGGDAMPGPRARQLPEDVPSAWESTRRYLEQRVLDAPADVHARLALAQHEMTRASTLRSGIVQISLLAGDREVGAAAIESWRDALAWTDGQASDIPLFQAFLRVRPRDAAVRGRLNEIARRHGVSPNAVAAVFPPPPLTGRVQDDISDTPPPLASSPALGYVPAPAPAPERSFAQASGPTPAAPVAAGTAAGGTEAQAKARGLEEEIDAIERERIATLSVGTVVRSRQGEKGMSQLTDTEIPISLRFDFGDGKATINVTPVILSSGTPATGINTISNFGGGPLLAGALPGVSAGSQNASGVGLGVGWESGNLQADLGTTPLGFRYTDVNAGIKYRLPVSDAFSFSIGLSRRPVTDSVLSFAGARDDRTGTAWGGVSATGGRLEANLDEGSYGLYGYGSLHRLTGHQVESNSRAELGAGSYWRILRTEDSGLTVGLALTALGFDKNLSFFTYGNGGYFSPQQFVSLAVPVEWRARTSQLSYRLNGSLGVQHMRTDSAPFFPLNPSLQTTTAAFYPGQSKTGLGYNLGVALEYQLQPQWFLGGRLAIDNARDYRQFNTNVYLRYAFGAVTGPQAMPVNTVRSPYAN